MRLSDEIAVSLHRSLPQWLSAPLLFQRREESDNVLDLLGAEDRLAGIGAGNARQAFGTIVGGGGMIVSGLIRLSSIIRSRN